jgi:trehalose 6-phosphate phosphatase
MTDTARRIPALPSALDRAGEIRDRLAGRRLALFLDFDGTLSPIVADPGAAVLAPGNRERLERLGRAITVAVISGRGLDDVRARVALDDLYYAGSHGFELSGPKGWHHEYAEGERFLADLNDAEVELREGLAAVPGIYIERKRFAIAAHDRRVPDAALAAIPPVVHAVAARHPSLRVTTGKRLHELQPNIDWHKGRAVLWLLHTLDLDSQAVLPIYVGDDLTDEDAFRALGEAGLGFGIVADEEDRPTAAAYALRGPADVGAWLDRVLAWLELRE